MRGGTEEALREQFEASFVATGVAACCVPAKGLGSPHGFLHTVKLPHF